MFGLQRPSQSVGMHGHFSFRLIGYIADLRYCLVPSAKKLAADLDTAPWSWPPVPSANLLALCHQPCPQLEARADAANAGGRKRKLLTFSEITDVFVEGRIRTERDAWMLAKDRKVAVDGLKKELLDKRSKITSSSA